MNDIKRNKLANDLCKEVRYQIANYGKIIDNDRLFQILVEWIIVAKNDKYERPILKGE